MNLKKILERYLRVNLLGPGPRRMKKRISRAAVSQRLRNTGLNVNQALRLYIIKLLKPTGYVMHQQFYIQQLYALPTLYLCVLYLSENKQRLVPLTA